MNHFPAVARTLAGLSIVAVFSGVILLVSLAREEWRRRLLGEGEGARTLLVIAWIAAAIAMAGSLYFSEVVGFIPCKYCWYQRIAMYPLVPVLGVAFLRREAGIWRYALPLSGIGLLISIYHSIIELRPSLAVGNCDAAAPCTTRLFAVLGFISIPVMAGAAFFLISALMLAVRAGERE